MTITALKWICRGIDLVVMLMGKAASYLMPMLAFVVAYEVFSRYVLNSPTIWAFDLSLFMFGYVAALGGAYAQQKKAHINVDILYFNVSQKTRRVFDLISYALGIFFLWIVLDMSIGKLLEAIEFDYRRESEWAPPMYHFWIMSIIACGLFIAQLGRDMLVAIYYLFTGKDLLAQENSDGN
ncbi:MAG: TRAP-type mannitol/chloroaromatic compound transport system, small permease component [Candidatus Accumulibacter regalis]|uniref:TRAP transporter small permease protein n=2 Tax=Candidatus Accumulibacter TaxID=327159 RepID=A0A011RHF0_ACCRE|nr:TRAP transporter small permease [Accumulibacter sp.]EXI90649.1 MAG: TRAP-type mannitol/chloroaromatic compound transport system, small permease component [Candidatus Accumulibacter regalis]MBN8513595.1 TRAP transporter small permease subunit [Accumulibacter sp.]MBO3701867.1 TRAP transporter small permease subunit [Accumulibacter sp.]HRE69175.1 TRAP transporter small permease [Accumulibacter sp.]